MSVYDWQVYKHDGTSWVQLTNVQGLAFTYGQRQLTDQWAPPVWTLSGRLPQNLGTVKIGDWISIINTGSPEFIYQVTNFEIFYGTVSSMDTWTMNIESAFSALARSVISPTWGNDIDFAFLQIMVAAGINGTSVLTGTVSSQNVVDENGLEVFSRLFRTSTSGVPYYTATPSASTTASSPQSIFGINAVPATSPSYFFTDQTPSGVQCVYDGLNFGGVNLNYATKVVVSPVGRASQTAGSGNNVFETSTYSATDADALNTANRYLGLLAASGSVPLSITFNKEQQPSGAVLPDQVARFNTPIYAKITFRNNDFYASIIGQDLTSTPGSTRITLQLCASDNSNFFTLNSASLGVLNQNRLGI